MSRGGQASWPGWQPGEPPEQHQLWWWGPGPQRPGRDMAQATPANPVRIGDAERDKAVSDLADHFAAGRLSRDEFDERADRAMQARFDRDLAPLFADLPTPEPIRSAAEPRRHPGGPPPWAYAMWLLPLVLVAAVAGSILLHAPFLIWIAIWLLVIGKITGHRHRRQLGPRGPFSPPMPR